MSIEQAILDRLEKRNGQIAQLQSTVHALERAADVEREHARQQLAPLIEENKKLAAQVDSEVTERRERLIKSLNDEITKRDHELRAHEKELAEQREEIRKLRAEVPLESTREGLKNAVAKLQEVTTDRDRVLNELAAIVAEANKTGRCGGDPVALLKQGQTDLDTAQSLERQIGGLTAEMKSLANQLMDAKAEASGVRGHANSWGCKEDETVTAFIQRLSMELAEAKTDLAETITLSNAKTLENRKLMDGHAEDMKAQAELLSKYESLLTKITDLGSYAMTIGRKEGEPLEMFMERQALRLAALETTIAAAKCDELAKATARIKPLEALYKTLKGWQENDHIIGYGLTIDTAINKATEALSQLTA